MSRMTSTGQIKTKAARTVSVLALGPLLSGCLLTVDAPPVPVVDTPPAYRAAGGAPKAALPQQDWWRGFRSGELTKLVERAQLANLDIAAAVARIEQADAQTRISGAPLLPAIGFDGDAQRSRSGGNESSRFSAVLNASYEIDLWGKNRAALRSAEFASVASRFDREVIVLSTVASVINTYFQVLAAQDHYESRATTSAPRRAILMSSSSASALERPRALISRSSSRWWRKCTRPFRRSNSRSDRTS
jgi:multidrug efflux system outer membrane protein